MWFWLSLIALLCWSGSDLFSKIGCRDADDKLAHLKMVIAVGVVMGLHAAYEIFIGGVSISWHVIWTYLPVSLLYIVSMALGYIGLRYIELSISSPICNSSGALVAVLCLITGTLDESITGAMRWMVIGAGRRGSRSWKTDPNRSSTSVGLRYIELSISSPICNSSGALVAVLCLITGTLDEASRSSRAAQ